MAAPSIIVLVLTYFMANQIFCCLFIQFEYKKQYEQSKGHYHLALDTAERLHHKENAVLQSQVCVNVAISSGVIPLRNNLLANSLFFVIFPQVKYKEYYEKSKGKSMLEFVDTQAYQVSKGVQKIQSEVTAFFFS